MNHVARIYQPDKNPMQSGKGKTKRWKLEYVPSTPYFVENLMGWNGSTDTTRQIELYFPTQEAAIAYANSKGIAFEVLKPQVRIQKPKSYADNFKYTPPRPQNHP